MKAFRTSLLAAAIVMNAGVAAKAADLIPPEESISDMGLYIRADAGWSFLDWTKNDDAPVLGAGLGYRFNDYLRADVRGDWAGNYDLAPGADMSISTVLGNLYFDVPTGTAFTPYVGAGVGYGFMAIDSAPNKNGLAYGLMAGVTVDLSQSMALDVGYRLREVLIDGDDPIEQQVTAGLRFSF